VRPEVVVEVTYLTWTEDNLLRQVSYRGQREDKPARQVVRAIPHLSRHGISPTGPPIAGHKLCAQAIRIEEL
jgi:hypothetical protein